MKNLEKLTNIIESILFVSGTQVAITDIAEKLGETDIAINLKNKADALKVAINEYLWDENTTIRNILGTLRIIKKYFFIGLKIFLFYTFESLSSFIS